MCFVAWPPWNRVGSHRNGPWLASACQFMEGVGALLNIPARPEQVREDGASPNLARPEGKPAAHFGRRGEGG